MPKKQLQNKAFHLNKNTAMQVEIKLENINNRRNV